MRRAVVNRIADCAATNRRALPLEAIKRVVVHRLSLEAVGVTDAELDALAMAKMFRDHPELRPVTGGACPYHFLVRPGGTIEQALPLSVRGAHAAAHNASSVGVALVGDFRRRAPTHQQQDALVRLLVALAPLNGGLQVSRHDSLAGGSSDPAKSCPGDGLHLAGIVARVTAELPEDWRHRAVDLAEKSVASMGVVLNA